MARGLLLPFRRDAAGADFATGTDDDADETLAVSKAMLVLGTRPGEIDWRPDFGCRIHDLRHQNNDDVLAALAVVRIREAFAKWLPSYYVPAGGVTARRDGRVLYLAVRFNTRSATGAPIFPRDLTAQVQVPLAA